MGGNCFPVAMCADKPPPAGAEPVWCALAVMASAIDTTGQMRSVAQEVKKFNLEENNGSGRWVALVETFQGPGQKVENIFVAVVF